MADGQAIARAHGEHDRVSVYTRLALPADFFWPDGDVAGEIEERFAGAGYIVISNARNHRMREDVPLLIPEVNREHLALVEKQSCGMIVTNPNCATIGLCLALKPLVDLWEVEAVHVTTLQAVSGAGYPGVASFDILDNVIPFISGEEGKLESEPRKVLGTYSHGKIDFYPVKISAQCNRVPVTNGHLECISVKLKAKSDARRNDCGLEPFSRATVALCSATTHHVCGR